MLACWCASDYCKVNGCQREKALRQDTDSFKWTSFTWTSPTKESVLEDTNKKYADALDTNEDLNTVLLVAEYLLYQGKTVQELVQRLLEPDIIQNAL